MSITKDFTLKNILIEQIKQNFFRIINKKNKKVKELKKYTLNKN